MRKHRTASTRPKQPAVVPGSAPGTIAIDPSAAAPVIRVIAYGPDDLVEQEVRSPSELRPLLESWPVVWVNVDGLGDEETLRHLAEVFDLHRLALEDVVSAGQGARSLNL